MRVISALLGAAFVASPVVAAPPAVRLVEPVGGFSYTAPQGWQVRAFPGQVFRSSFIVPDDANGFAPNINVKDHLSTLPVTKYVRLVQANIASVNSHIPGFRFLGQTPFATQSGVHGYKVEAETPPGKTTHNLTIRQTFYIFPGRRNHILIATASLPAQLQGRYGAAIDAAMKTFSVKQ